MTVAVLAVILPALTYILLSIKGVQNFIKEQCETELSNQLGADVSIDDLSILPFNRALIRGVTVSIDGDTVGSVREIGAGIDVWRLVWHREVAINYASVIGLDALICRDSANAPLNIQPIIDRLTNKDHNKPPARFNLRINTIVLRDLAVSYDVNSEPLPQNDRFDQNHIRITGLRADASLPRLRNGDIIVDLKRLDFKERSGFALNDLSGKVHVSDSLISWRGVDLKSFRSDLSLTDGSLQIDSLSEIKNAFMTRGVHLGIEQGSVIYPPAFAMFMPELASIDGTFNVMADMQLSGENVALNRASLTGDGMLFADISNGTVMYPFDREELTFNFPDIEVRVYDRLTRMLLSGLPTTSAKISSLNLPALVQLAGSAQGSLLSGTLDLAMSSDDGDLNFMSDYRRRDLKSPLRVEGIVSARDLHLGDLTRNADLGSVDIDATLSAQFRKRLLSAKADVNIENLEYRRHIYDKIHLLASLDGTDFIGNFISFDPDAAVDVTAKGSVAKGDEWVDLSGLVECFAPEKLNLAPHQNGAVYSGSLTAKMTGTRPDRGTAEARFRNLAIASDSRPEFKIDSLTILSQSEDVPRKITVSSDLVNGEIMGDYDFTSLASQIKAIAADALPALDLPQTSQTLSPADRVNDFTFEFTIEETEPLRDIFRLPVSSVYPMTFSGKVNSRAELVTAKADIPYLRQGNKLIEHTKFELSIDGENETEKLLLTTKYPSNDGLTTYTLRSNGEGNDIMTDVTWKIDRQRRYDGEVKLKTRLERDDENRLGAIVDVMKSEIAFNDSVWTIHPAQISYANGVVDVDGVNVSRANQYVKINGRGSASDSDSIAIDVLNVDLDYVFEAIGIDKFQLGGEATGTLYASSVLSPIPHVETEGIKVKNIAYNKCVLGEGLVKSRFDMTDKAIVIDGTIMQPNGGVSTVDGRLYPFTSELDFRIHADRTRVGFMEYYMSAFASDISGFGSGDLHLFGDFHDVDLEGDVFAEDLRLKLDFTNTYFTATDSIFISPGTIRLKDVTLRDPQGHTGKLTGVVHHDFFRSPTFDFKIYDVDKMLVYNESSRQNADWYGRIFASGEAQVQGDDNTVRINIDVTTADDSQFTFVLSELEVADEYTFLTFRDKAKLNGPTIVEGDVKLSAVNRLRELLSQKQAESSANYIIEVKVDITPGIEVDLVMDPVAGDKIRSNGSGNLRMVYTSADNDLRMFGTYRLDQGFYNFTLQDIIIKDFVIKEGSSISFTGDPLTARLDIRAYYALNANLTDLDETFREDKDLNRTNVPVHALLNVTGDIQNPEIKFDLEFPTLTSDTYRKVRSIVSTEEMMNRQIIYLLALNRFYTPDYMSTTKGNELFSVASSTISSQLSSILGQLSDNWMISPNFRSDRGDFSDMEVDLALSSRLLNNRLLLNGNFGYRDKSLNTNQFIGDFDIEYLLNKPGTIRLKAYNHYNDQNYYIRSANTTQGVGVMFKHDFDNIFGFLRRHKKDEPIDDNSVTADSIENTISKPDSIDVSK